MTRLVLQTVFLFLSHVDLRFSLEVLNLGRTTGGIIQQ